MGLNTIRLDPLDRTRYHPLDRPSGVIKRRDQVDCQVDGRVDSRANSRVDNRVDRWVDRWVNSWANSRVDSRVHNGVNRRIDRRVYLQVDSGLDYRIAENIQRRDQQESCYKSALFSIGQLCSLNYNQESPILIANHLSLIWIQIIRANNANKFEIPFDDESRGYGAVLTCHD